MATEKEHNTTQQEPTTEKKGNDQKASKEKDFWEEARENITEGAKAVGETVSEYSEKVIHSLSETASDAYKFSSEFTKDAVKTAQEFIEEYREKNEVKNLSDKRDEWTARLGLHFYHTIKDNEGHIPRNFLTGKIVTTLLNEIERIDQEILELKNKNSETK